MYNYPFLHFGMKGIILYVCMLWQILMMSTINLEMASASSAAFKGLPPFEEDTGNGWNVWKTSLHHYSILAGQKFADVLDMKVDQASLSKEHDSMIHAVIAISMGDGSKCPRAMDAMADCQEKYSGRATILVLNTLFNAGGATSQSTLLIDLMNLSYVSLGHSEYKRQFNDLVRRLAPSLSVFPEILKRGLILKSLPQGVSDNGFSWAGFLLEQTHPTQEKSTSVELFEALARVDKMEKDANLAGAGTLALYTPVTPTGKAKSKPLAITPARPGGYPGARKCSHCQGKGHDLETCYKAHPELAPPGWKPRAKKVVAAANIATAAPVADPAFRAAVVCS
jgi:hypothetical protein